MDLGDKAQQIMVIESTTVLCYGACWTKFKGEKGKRE
jgi:hypothetical protein